jgi:tetratricopeptide (TPR) repeat protein
MLNSGIDSFGALLKIFRKRRYLTQQQLAEAIGVHRNAISRWEQGSFLPEQKGIVLELARHLYLDDQETRQLLEASFTALAPPWEVPFSRNPFFTGREKLLERLYTYLGTHQEGALTCSYALYGMGGVGKTQVAIEYAYRHALEYSAVFWIAAETAEHITSSFLRIAEVLHLFEQPETDQRRIVTAVQRWLVTHHQWLLIWDNLEELALLQRFLPSNRQGAVLITTHLQTFGTLAQGIELVPMRPEEGMLFVLRRAKVLEPTATNKHLHLLSRNRSSEYSAAEELVTAMGGLPLALDQAGAYIEETGCNLLGYLQRYKQQRMVLLKRRGTPEGGHPYSVASTFLLTSEHVGQKHSIAAGLLYACTFLHAEAIPEELFTAGAAHLGPMLEPIAVDPSQFDLAVAVLKNLSLVQRSSETRTLSLHRLVQVVLQESMSESEQTAWLKRIVVALRAIFPEVIAETWQRCERLLPHVLAVVNTFPDNIEDWALVELLRKTADYFRERLQYDQAELLYQRALSIAKKTNTDHVELIHVLSSFALLFYTQEKYDQAEIMYRQALHIWKQVSGMDPHAVARSLNNLAILYTVLGKYTRAVQLFQQALLIWEQTFGPEHPKVAYAFSGLAEVFLAQGKYEQVEPFCEHALQIWEKTLGSMHSLVAYPLITLADLYTVQRKYEQAESYYQQALQIWKHSLGMNHPQLANALNGLANLYANQGKYTKAEPLFQQVLYIREQAWGTEHSCIAHPLNGLANLYLKQRKDMKAKSLLQRALALQEQRLGPYHPDTAQTLHDLAIFYQRQGNLIESISLAKRALEIRLQALGDAHPKTVATQAYYIHITQEHRRIKEEKCSEQCAKENRVSCGETGIWERASRSSQVVADSPLSHHDSFQKFLSTYCDLYPQAWSRSADLWRAYQQWIQDNDECHPLSQRRFLASLKERGCQPARTNTSRIWRGITLKAQPDG